MAELHVTRTRIQLKRDEQVELERNMQDLAKRETEQLTRFMRENFKRRKKFRGRVDNILRTSQVDLKQLQNEVKKDHKSLDEDYVARAKRTRRIFRERPKEKTNAVWGLPSGVERPRYDFSWTYHNVVGTPLDFDTTAEPGTGNIRTYAHGHDSSPKMVDARAGVGFWYIPNRVGAPSIREVMWTGAVWNDVGAAGGWISLGIASYLR
jgi:hypothetical protein